MKRVFVILIAALTVLSGCKAAPKRFSASYTDVFDTVTDFTAYCSSQEEFDRLSKAAHEELLRLHRIFDIYNTYDGLNNAKSLNDGVSGEYPKELCEIIGLSKQWYSESDGALNIALGSVLSLWHDCREAKVLPDADELKSRSAHCDIDGITVDGRNIRLSDSMMSIDLGAVAKGYAAQKTAELLESLGAENFALSVGGNVVTRGKKPSGNWEIGIQSPDGGILMTLSVSGESIVTSGDYQRFYEVDGVIYHHIIDPKNLWPASLWRSVTVIFEDSSTADALSTALFCLPYEDGAKLLEKYGAEAVWVSKDGEITCSEGVAKYEK